MNEQEQPGWEYKPNDTAGASPAGLAPAQSAGAGKPVLPVAGEFSWQASEFSDHHRPVTWYLGLLGATAAIAGGVYFVTKDKFSTGVAIVLGIVVLLSAARKPRTLDCAVSSGGIRVGAKNYPFGQFKAFGILRETDLPSLELFSTKKLLPPVTVHFDPKDEKQITDIIGNHLPYEERAMAGIDKLAHRLRI